MIPVERDEFTYAKPRIRQYRDDGLVAPLEVVWEGVGKAAVTDLLDLFGGEPGGSLFPSLSA